MSSEHEIAIITVGYKSSPFIEQIIDKENIPFSIVANNGSDFQIHHADPTKILNYSLEFTNIIETIAKKSMDSLAVFETLGQFFEFYNPLHLSTLNYLISKYATNIKPENTNYLEAWKQITNAIFDEEFIFPLFEETRIFHIREGDVELPVRQFLISNKLELLKNNSKNNNKSKEQLIEEITGIIDVDKVEKMKLCGETAKKIVSASAVIIVPTDMSSLFIMFKSESFKENLQKTDGKIALISPLWPGNEVSKLEESILIKTEFEPNLLNLVDLIKESVDVLIIDTKDSDLVPQLREAGVTVLVEDLNPETQQTEEFLDTVLKTMDLSLETVLVEPKKAIEGLGEKLVNLFRVREPKKEETAESSEQVALEESREIIDTLFEEELKTEEVVSENITPVLEETSDVTEEESLTDEFEMEVIDTEEEVLPIPAPPAKTGSIESEILSTKAEGQFLLPGIEQITQLELEELDSLDVDEHIITSIIDRAISSSNVTGLEVVFSDLLSLQNNPLLIDKIYQMIMKRLMKLRETNPEEKIAVMVTYLSAHKPDYYTEKLEDLLEDTITTKDEEEFYKNLRTAALIVKSSLIIAGDVIENFLSSYMQKEDVYLENRIRRIINVFAITDPDLQLLVNRILLKIYKDELKKEEVNEAVIDKIISINSTFDAITVGISLILDGTEALLNSFSEKILQLNHCDSFKKIVADIVIEYNEGRFDDLVKALHGRSIPESVEYEMMKKKYENSLSKVGSIPLEIFAERVGHPIEKAEKIIYDMILKEEIQARIELVSGRLYIVEEQEGEEVEEIEVKEEVDEEPPKKPAKKPVKKPSEKPTKKPTKKPAKKPVKKSVEKPAEKPEKKEEFVCPDCQKTYNTERGLKMHISKSHKKD